MSGSCVLGSQIDSAEDLIPAGFLVNHAETADHLFKFRKRNFESTLDVAEAVLLRLRVNPITAAGGLFCIRGYVEAWAEKPTDPLSG